MSKAQSPAPGCASSVWRRSSRNQGQHGVRLERRIAREVDARVDLTRRPLAKRQTLMCGACRTALRVASGSRPDRLEHTGAVCAGRQTPNPQKPVGASTSIGSCGPNVNAIGIGLPHLDQGIWQRHGVAIEDTNPQPDALAARVGAYGHPSAR